MQWIATILGILATAGMALLSWSQRRARVEGVATTKIATLEHDVKALRQRVLDLGDIVGKLSTELVVRVQQGRIDDDRIERQLQHLGERQDEMWQYFKRNGGGNDHR